MIVGGGIVAGLFLSVEAGVTATFTAENENWGALNNSNPMFHIETWQVGIDKLTWALRHAHVKYWAEVNPKGAISIQYRLSDRLDLSGSKGRTGAYNNISNVLGFGYHTLGGQGC